jgi:hypothetical protein
MIEVRAGFIERITGAARGRARHDRWLGHRLIAGIIQPLSRGRRA